MRLGKDHHVEPFTCPYCKKRLDGVAGVDTDTLPEPEDVSICVVCGGVSVFAEQGCLRKPSLDELDEILQREGVQEALNAFIRSMFERDNVGHA